MPPIAKLHPRPCLHIAHDTRALAILQSHPLLTAEVRRAAAYARNRSRSSHGVSKFSILLCSRNPDPSSHLRRRDQCTQRLNHGHRPAGCMLPDNHIDQRLHSHSVLLNMLGVLCSPDIGIPLFFLVQLLIIHCHFEFHPLIFCKIYTHCCRHSGRCQPHTHP